MKTTLDVLLVEDNKADADLTRETFSFSRLPVRLRVAVDGDEALTNLSHWSLPEVSALPDLILLDLNLPRRSGHEILQQLKADDRLRHIPVVVLTSSESPTDIERSYRLGASCYVSKPVDFRAFRTIVEAIQHFWFDVARLPVGQDGHGR